MEQELWNRNCGTGTVEQIVAKLALLSGGGGGQILFFKGLGRVDR